MPKAETLFPHRLLGVPEAGLERALTHRTIATRSEEMTSPIAAVECAETRDALSKVSE